VPEVLSNRERIFGISLGVALGSFLALTFLPSVNYLQNILEIVFFRSSYPNPDWIKMGLFVSFAGFLFFSLPKRSRHLSGDFSALKSLWPSFVVPVAISMVFGFVVENLMMISSPNPAKDLLWFVVCIPLSEELLFRGWAWTLFRSLFKEKLFTLTNPLQSEIIFSSVTFSLWHIQNWDNISGSFLIFQLLYTFFAGIWLGYLRKSTGNLSAPILAHVLINLGASIPAFL